MGQYEKIRKEIDTIAEGCGRNPKEITLVGVTKNHSWDEAKELYDAGCRNFGENRVPEALEKQELAPDDCQWHMIGSLQRKKIPKIIGKFSLIHSVDSIDLAEKINSGATRQPILLQVSVAISCC